jgi:hypothetical protein
MYRCKDFLPFCGQPLDFGDHLFPFSEAFYFHVVHL